MIGESKKRGKSSPGKEIRKTGWVRERLVSRSKVPILRKANSRLHISDFSALLRSILLYNVTPPLIQTYRGATEVLGFRVSHTSGYS